MSVCAIESAVCHTCYRVIDVEDSFCRYCGAASGEASEPEVVTATCVAAPRKSWQDNPWILLPVLLLGVGPLGLPMLWRGQAFKLPGKIAVTALISAMLALSIWLSYEVVMLSLEPLRQLRQL